MRKGRGRREFRAPLSDESSGAPQNEQKLTPLSCPGTTGRHAEKKVREYGSNAVFPQYLDLFYYFFVKRIRRERDGALIP